jgi:meiosis-specific transcription factor NDT80
MASSSGYGPGPNESAGFPWPNLEVLVDMTCEGQGVTPEIVAKVEKGFFQSTVDNKWTCYRRNYFAVACHFELHPTVNNARIYLKRHNSNQQELIQAMGMRLSAAVDGSNGKSIELIQHTPKRDNGPKNKVDITKVSPTPTGRGEHTVSPHGVYTMPMGAFHPTGAVPGPYLPLQNVEGANGAASSLPTPQMASGYGYSSTSHLQAPGQHTNHTFERIQFKQATANNGKRRASQQYFHLIVELFADVRKDGADSASWVKVAQRVSEKIVVRGRSPSHYQEGQHGQAGRGNASGGSSYNGSLTGAGYHVNTGAFRSSAGGYGGSMGGSSGYRQHYGMHPGSDGSGSSPGSVEEGAHDTDHLDDTVMSDADRANLVDNPGYQYYPGTMYESVPQQILPPLAKVESNARYSTEPRHFAVKAEYADAVPGASWQAGSCSRFQGMILSPYPCVNVLSRLHANDLSFDSCGK